MKIGFTTGSCAAAAAGAAAWMLFSGKRLEEICIDTPAGVEYRTAIEEISMEEGAVSCAVRKHSGDDPDVTDGILVCARVRICPDGAGEVRIDGGEGVGRVSRPGLDRPVGDAAINSVPRRMITKEVREVMEAYECRDSVEVWISVPGGEELAAKTFNPRLGIVGGISIIGTSGLVEPMSTRALLDTIAVELRQQKEEGAEVAVVSPGNYGLDFMKESYAYDLDRAVKCSNFIGETIDMAADMGFRKFLLVGHVGKLIKLSGGIMDTHSSKGDCRMELLAAAAVRCDAPVELLGQILDCVNTEEACGFLFGAGIEKPCFAYIMERISYFLNKRAAGRMDVQCLVYAKQWGLLGQTPQAESYLRESMGR